jgi:hypothetical protein
MRTAVDGESKVTRTAERETRAKSCSQNSNRREEMSMQDVYIPSTRIDIE